MKLPVKVEVNGTTYEEEVDARQLLVHFLRDRLGLTGTHVGCDTSQCGACTIIMDGQAVKSCTVLAVQANGSSLRTVEGLSHDGELHPIQKGFWEKHGLQCGYCTPGMMMTALHILERNPNPSNEDIRRDLEGVLCRCTGYQNIVQAIQQAAAEMRGAPAGH
ncbi:MAG TPA: (2Fe-2S)-binding protein [Chloroflexota bacterium]|nr:(2Fe-2S)-binding protein [Chloroflexota bacterium]